MATDQLSPQGGDLKGAAREADPARAPARRMLAEAGALLSASADFEEPLRRVAELAVPTLADWFSIELLAEDGSIQNVGVAHVDADRVELVRELGARFPPSLDDPHGIGKVLRTGAPELYPEITDELLVETARGPEQLDIARSLGLRSAVVVPLSARGLLLGALTLASAESGRSYGTEDLPFVQELASLAALAIDNARLYRDELSARERAEEAMLRTERLQAFTAELATATTTDMVVKVAIREAIQALRADRGALYRLSEGEQRPELVGSVGYAGQPEATWMTFSADLASPAVEAVATRDLVIVESEEQLVERWPHLAETQDAALSGASICVPLETEGEVRWLLVLGFPGTRHFSDSEQAMLRTMASQCAHALERGQLYEAARSARADALRMARRLRALQSVMDAALAPESLDDLLHDILERVRDALGADTAAILMVDPEEEDLVSRGAIGISEEAHRRVRIPIGSGFAGGIAATRKPLLVDDTSKLDIFSPVLRGSGVRSLAGVPLLVEADRVVGVLHVGSYNPGSFSDDDILLLRLVGSRAGLAIEHAVLHERQRSIAETLQRSLLPDRLPRLPGTALAARYVPGAAGLEVGGDWYDALAVGNGRLAVVVGDVVGRGIHAASAMGQLRNAVRAYALEGLEPAEILSHVNQLAFEFGRKELFATAVVGVVDIARGTGKVASAGHPPPLVFRPQGQGRFVERGRSLPLGATRDAPFEETSVDLPFGSTLLLYSDGLIERRHEPIEDSFRRLQHAAVAGPEDLDPLLDHLLATFPSDERGDDLAVLALRLLDRPVEPLRLRYQARPSALASLRAALREWLGRAGASAQELHEVTVACNEACTNAIEHPLRAPGSDFFEVEADCADRELSLVVRDFGRWRDTSPSGDRGRGLRFIHALMDDVEVRSAASGTEVHMRRRLGTSGG